MSLSSSNTHLSWKEFRIDPAHSLIRGRDRFRQRNSLSPVYRSNDFRSKRTLVVLECRRITIESQGGGSVHWLVSMLGTRLARSVVNGVADLSERTILVTAYFSGDDQSAKLDYFERIDARLRERDARLLLINLSPKRLECRCDNLSIPYFIPYAAFFEWARLHHGLRLKEELEEAVQVEAGDLNLKVELARLKLLYFRAFMRSVLRRERPALCVLWHQFNGLHHALVDLLNESSIPHCFAEYGPMPGMIALDRKGQMAESCVAVEAAAFRVLPVEPETLERADRYIEMVRAQKRSQRQQPTNEDALQHIREKHAQGKKVVFMAGDYGYRSGMLPPGFPRARLHSPFFESTEDALACVAALASKNDWHIIFKPHPLGTDAARMPEAPNEHVTVMPDANAFDCVLNCDITVTILSQVSYLALLQNRPIVLLGRNMLSGQGCAYELESKDHLESLITQAVRDGLTSEQRETFRRHTAQLCTHYLFSMDRDVEELFGRGPVNAADFLLEMAQPCPPSEEVPDEASLSGTWGTDKDLAFPWRTRAAYAILSFLASLFRVGVSMIPPAIKNSFSKTRRWF